MHIKIIGLGLASHEEEESSVKSVDSSWCECGQKKGLHVLVEASNFISASFLVHVLEQLSHLHPQE